MWELDLEGSVSLTTAVQETSNDVVLIVFILMLLPRPEKLQQLLLL